LDEVVALDDRRRLIGAIKALFDFIPREQDSFVVVTTRPQGYADEIAALPKLYLVPLGKYKALQYARRLVDTRFDDDRRDIVYRRLEEAAANTTTLRLMRSPLQITIMTTLVSALGRAPTERWTLFKEYYRVIYEREMERNNLAAQLLSTYRKYIDKIHTQAGLLLQVEAEHSGGTGSWMTKGRFDQIIHAVLAEDDIDGASRDEIAQKLIGEKGDCTGGLMKVMGDRLVLLVERAPDQIHFEVRSIQEFMAAWALSLKDEKTVERRMGRIARASSFRNVLLFLASRAFTDLDLSGLRDVLVERICPELNDSKDEPLARATLAGSMLALEILEEGSALRQNKYVKKLVQLAVRIVELPPSPEHPRLVRMLLRDAETTRVTQSIVEEAIGKQFELPDPQSRFGAWVVLLDLAAQGQTWAQTMAEAKWEGDASGLGGGLGAALDQGCIEPKDWLDAFLGTRFRHLDPYSLFLWLNHAAYDPKRRRSLPKSGALQAFFALLHEPRRIHLKVLLDGAKTPLHLNFLDVDQDIDDDWRALAKHATGSLPFAPLVAAVHFILEPTASNLARQLEYVAAHFDQESIHRFTTRVPWPLAACLKLAVSPDALRNMAALVQEGKLGDYTDWKAAQTRWRRARSIDFEQLFSFGDNELPWPANLSEYGFPVIGASAQWHFIHPVISWSPLLERLRAELRHPGTRRVQALLADWFTKGLQQFIGDDFDSPTDPIRVESAHGKLPEGITVQEAQKIFDLTDEVRLDVIAAMRPWIQSDPKWIDLIDQAAKNKRLGVSRAPLNELASYLSRALDENPSRSGLLFALRMCADTGARTFVNVSLLKSALWANEVEQEDVYLLRLAQGEIEVQEAVAGAKTIAQASTGPRYPLGTAVEILEDKAESLAYVAPTLLTLLEHAPPNVWSWRGEIIRRLRRILGASSTRLDNAEVWTELALPLPGPLSKSSPSSAPFLDAQGPVRIESIRLENVRTIKELTLKFVPPHNGSGQWIVLIGENGTGKTTILRSLVLALRRIGTLPDTAHNPPFRRNGIERDEPCIIHTRVSGKTYALNVRADNKGGDDPVRESDSETSVGFPLFAYGARRGSALGGAKPTIDFTSPKEIETLFREGAFTNHAEGWLMSIYLIAKANPGDTPYSHKWEAVKSVLFSLLPGLNKIDGDEESNRIWFEGERIERTTTSGLSDGYLMTLGWVVDLLSRYLHGMEQRKDPIEREFNLKMTGLVIIDEPDEFLHPVWQKEIIATLRGVFPKMSFVMTTHNPLTLLGARHGEIHVLRRSSENQRIEVRQFDLPKGIRPDQVLTGEWFGLPYAVDDETINLVEEHRQLLLQKTSPDDARRQEIEKELRKRFGTYADTSLDRMALEVAAELMRERQPETPEDRKQLRDQLKQRLKEKQAQDDTRRKMQG
jgi:energy-coupling factor transporter ATP-binding protein EcfA2